MGFFKSRQEKEVPDTHEEPHYHHPLLEIVRIVCSNNPEILDSARKCIKNTEKYYQSHLEDYEARGMSLKNPPASLQWMGCIDLLIHHQFACECDWCEELSGFLSAVSDLKTVKRHSLEIEESWFQQQDSIPQWCEILDKKWEKSGYVLAAFDIDSDSYVMFLCQKNFLKKLKDLAESLGFRIDLSMNM